MAILPPLFVPWIYSIIVVDVFFGLPAALATFPGFLLRVLGFQHR